MDGHSVALNLLEMYEFRLRFIDVYDQLLEKVADAINTAAAMGEVKAEGGYYIPVVEPWPG